MHTQASETESNIIKHQHESAIADRMCWTIQDLHMTECSSHYHRMPTADSMLENQTGSTEPMQLWRCNKSL